MKLFIIEKKKKKNLSTLEKINVKLMNWNLNNLAFNI